MGVEAPDPQIVDRVKAIVRRDLKLGPSAAIADDMPFFGGDGWTEEQHHGISEWIRASPASEGRLVYPEVPGSVQQGESPKHDILYNA